MNRRRAALAAASVVSAVALTGPAHAVGDDSAIGLSYDGVHYTDSLRRPLFDPAVRWVPGDVRTARFFIRNLHPEAGVMTLDVERSRDVELRDTGFLGMTARTGDGPWTQVADGDISRLIDGDMLASGRPVPVEIRVSMGDAAPNGTMVLSSDLDLHVVVSQYLPHGQAGPAGDLPNTGNPVPGWAPPLALAALGLGAWLMRRRRDDVLGRPAHLAPAAPTTTPPPTSPRQKPST